MKTTLLELAGFALVAYGFGLAWLPLGFIVGGALLAFSGYLAHLTSSRDESADR